MMDMTDMLERYLQAVGQYLPAETRRDTLAELRANLLAQMEDREEMFGRGLEESDVAKVLREHGKPEAVALRYLPQRSLIGPTIFPFYKFATIKALPLVVFVYAIAEFATMMSKGGMAAYPHVLWTFAWNLGPTLLVYLAWMTVAFAAAEEIIRRFGVPKRWMQWDPAKLPPVKPVGAEAKPKPLARRVFELCVHCAWMAYILAIPWHAYWRVGAGTVGIDLDSFGVTYAPVWHTFYELLVVLLTVQLVMKLLALVEGTHRWLKPLDLVADALGLAAVGWMAMARVYFVSLGVGANLHQMSQVNDYVSLAFRVAWLCVAVGFMVKVWPHVKRWTPKKSLAF